MKNFLKLQLFSFMILACNSNESLLPNTKIEKEEANATKDIFRTFHQAYKGGANQFRKEYFQKKISQRYFELMDPHTKSIIYNNEIQYRINKNHPPLKGLLNVGQWKSYSLLESIQGKKTNDKALSPFLNSVYFQYLEVVSRYPEYSHSPKDYVEFKYKVHLDLADIITRMKMWELDPEEEKIVNEAEAYMINPKSEFMKLFLSNSIYMSVFLAISNNHNYFNLGVNSFKHQFFTSSSSYYQELCEILENIIRDLHE